MEAYVWRIEDNKYYKCVKVCHEENSIVEITN